MDVSFEYQLPNPKFLVDSGLYVDIFKKILISKTNFIQPDSVSTASASNNKGIFQNTTINLPSSSTRVDSGSNRINSLFNYLNLSLNDPTNKNQTQAAQLAPNALNSLANTVINPNAGANSFNRHTFNYFDNDLLKSGSNEK